MNKDNINLESIIEKAIEELYDKIDTIVKELNRELVEILKKGIRYNIEIVDVGYDVSEYPESTEKQFNVYDYSTVEDFLKEATGNRIATFMSGAGFMAERYNGYFQDLIMEKKYNIAKEVFIRETNINTSNKTTREEDDLFDDFNNIFFDNSIDIEQQIMEKFSQQKIYSIFN